jgi:hypothetical protein
VKIFDRFRLWRLKQLSTARRTIAGTPLQGARTIVLLYKHNDEAKGRRIEVLRSKLREAGGPELKVVPMAFWHKMKPKKGEDPAPPPFTSLPAPWLHFDQTEISSWQKPKSMELRRFINTDYDMLLYCETTPCWVLEEILARSKARMKVGPAGLVRSEDLDIILSSREEVDFETHLQAMFNFLINTPLQSTVTS